MYHQMLFGVLLIPNLVCCCVLDKISEHDLEINSEADLIQKPSL